jgi:hypothetical protein
MLLGRTAGSCRGLRQPLLRLAGRRCRLLKRRDLRLDLVIPGRLDLDQDLGVRHIAQALTSHGSGGTASAPASGDASGMPGARNGRGWGGGFPALGNVGSGSSIGR